MKLILDNSCLSQVEFKNSLKCLESALVFMHDSLVCHVDFANSADLVVSVAFPPNLICSNSDLNKLFRKLRKEFKVSSFYFDTYLSANHSFLYFVLFLDFKNYD